MRKLSKIVFIVGLAVIVIAAFTACEGEEVTSPIDIVVTFDSSGGSEVPSVTVEKDGIIKLPEVPTKEGYSFGGWYVDKETKTALEITGKIPASITVYAKWLKVYAVTFASGEGATGTAPTMEKQVEGASITLPENAFEKEGCVFKTWFDGTTEYQANASYVMGAQNVTFTATWLTISTNISYTLSDDGTSYYVSGYEGRLTEAVIAPTYNGLPVKSIGDHAFYKCTGLTTLNIPSSVISIEAKSFGWCIGLTTISISSSVTSIGDSAFEYCYGLTTLNIPSSVTSIGAYAFYSCEELTTVTFGENSQLTSIGDHAFMSCKGLTTITIPSAVTSIGDDVFSWCDKLTTVTILSGGTNIGKSVFNLCNKLVQITNLSGLSIDELPRNPGQEIRTDLDTPFVNAISTDSDGITTYTVGETVYCMGYTGSETELDLSGKGITAIYQTAFYKNITLTSITIPSSVTSIGNSAFYGCTGLITVNIPSSVTSIGSSAFYGCEELTTVTFSENSQLTSIGSSAFQDCEELTTITIPSSVTSIGLSAFYETAWYNNQPDGLVYAGKLAYHYKGTMPNNTVITLREDTTGIADGAFSYCEELTAITFPSFMTNIGKSVFNLCNKLVQITNLSGLTLSEVFPENPGQEIRTDLDTPFVNTLSTDSDGITTYTVGAIVYYIGYTGSETELDLSGKGITAIYQYAFYNNGTLTSITIPSSVESIGDSAFSYCNRLITVNFGESSQLTSIGDFVFYECTKLTTISIPSSVTSIGDSAFSYCDRLITVSFGESSQLISIGNSAFSFCMGLTTITIPSSVTSIGYNGFNFMGYRSAFNGCYKLVQITNLSGQELSGLPNNLGQEIHTDLDTPFVNTFSTDSDGITTYTVGETVYCFDYTGNEATLDLSDKGITALYEYAFYKNRTITSITIPSSVTSIVNSAFSLCSELITINYGGTMAQWNAISRESSWPIFTIGRTYTIYCTDGNIANPNIVHITK